MDEIMALLNSRITGEIDAEYQAARSSASNRGGAVAILPLYGVVSQKVNLMVQYSGGTSTEMFGQWFDEAMADSSISSIVLDVDSPGGSVYGIAELSRKIYNARGKKPIIAVANSLMASAAYWVASAADEIHVSPGGEVGSIGVIAVHVDRSGANEKAGIKVNYVTAGDYKAEGNPDEPLQDEALGYMQSRVNDYYSMFVSDVARNRKVSTSEVLSKFGQGRVVGADMAIKQGMADKKSSFEFVLRSTASRRS